MRIGPNLKLILIGLAILVAACYYSFLMGAAVASKADATDYNERLDRIEGWVFKNRAAEEARKDDAAIPARATAAAASESVSRPRPESRAAGAVIDDIP
jgi:hypothetical protein